jgi:peptide methionine sulfoxide reductase MsrA
MVKLRHPSPAARHARPPAPLTGQARREPSSTSAGGRSGGVEADIRGIPGIVQTAVSYTGEHVPNLTYRQVCGNRTGHAEAVEVWFDPAQVDYALRTG